GESRPRASARGGFKRGATGAAGILVGPSIWSRVLERIRVEYRPESSPERRRARSCPVASGHPRLSSRLWPTREANGPTDTAGATKVGGRELLLLFVVLLLDVDRPDVVVGAEDVLHREHGREHRVVLVVVLVHAVAPDGV